VQRHHPRTGQRKKKKKKRGHDMAGPCKRDPCRDDLRLRRADGPIRREETAGDTYFDPEQGGPIVFKVRSAVSNKYDQTGDPQDRGKPVKLWEVEGMLNDVLDGCLEIVCRGACGSAKAHADDCQANPDEERHCPM
jgi:hypothetical protein